MTSRKDRVLHSTFLDAGGGGVNDRPAETPKGDGSRISNLTRTHARDTRWCSVDTRASLCIRTPNTMYVEAVTLDRVTSQFAGDFVTHVPVACQKREKIIATRTCSDILRSHLVYCVIELNRDWKNVWIFANHSHYTLIERLIREFNVEFQWMD